MRFHQFDTYDDLMIHLIGNEPFDMPKAPIEPEDIQNITDLLLYIDFLEKHKLNEKLPKFRRLCDCKGVLEEVNQMVGMKAVKETLATQVMSICSIEKNNAEARGNMNTTIYGKPGCGKTTLARILAKVYLQSGFTSNDKFICGNRVNMIGEYLGETSQKTNKVLKSALGGVLFIDEVYQFGHAADGNRDIFAKECIDIIVGFITEHIGELVIIIAGYEKDVINNFFAQNDGLDRRFPKNFRHRLEDYDEVCLYNIFCLQAKQAGYTIDSKATAAQGKIKIRSEDNKSKLINKINKLLDKCDFLPIDKTELILNTLNEQSQPAYCTLTVKNPSTINMFAGPPLRLPGSTEEVMGDGMVNLNPAPAISPSFFKEHFKLFPNYGGDTENFINCCKAIHNKRMFGKQKTDKILNAIDIDKGFEMYQIYKSREDKSNEPPSGMYL